MNRVSKLARWVAGGLVSAAGAMAAEPILAPAPHAVEQAADPVPAPAPHTLAPVSDPVPAPPPHVRQRVAAPPFMPLAPVVPIAPLAPLAPSPVTSGSAGVPFAVAPPTPGGFPVQAPLGTGPGPAAPPGVQPTPGERGPADTTRQPIDRILQAEAPTNPNQIDAAAQASYTYFPTLGFAGQSGVVPRSGRNNEYDTVEDRWRIGFPEWDRYDLGHPKVFDYPYQLGHWFDPYRQNVLKGDYPIIGQHTFLEISGESSTFAEGRMLPTAATSFESTARPFTTDFFGKDGQFAFSELTMLTFDLFHGDAAFKPVDWRVLVTPAFNFNTLSVQETGVTTPNVLKGTVRDRSWTTLQEYFVEYKIADLSPEYDFISVRAGSQPFTSDFRGFIYSDVNRGVRLFGNLDGNRTQYNLAFFRQLDKDVNSELNTFNDRNQNVIIANLYRQDFIFPGYTSELSFHYNDDGPSLHYDQNGFLVRPDPVGEFTQHRVQACYFGWAGDGHIDRFNITHAFYWVVGHDSLNPLAGQSESINAQMAAIELSYDRDWTRFRVSGLYQSGDGNANNGHATGFDGILDNQNFGGEFSFWRRLRIPLFGVGLTNDQSNYADLRSNRVNGQSNFVNPGLWLGNLGVDFDVTSRFRIVNNANVLFFDKTNVLETFLYQSGINRFIGVDLSSGYEWRPRLNNNAIVIGGVSALIPGEGFRDLYNNKGGKVPTMFSALMEVILKF
jgi:hypothetical protein